MFFEEAQPAEGGAGGGNGADPADGGTPEAWYAAIENEDVRAAASKFDDQKAFLETIKYQPPDNWREGLNDDAKKFAETSPDVNHLVGRALDFQKKLSSAVVIPGKNASEEEVAAYHKRIGVPKTADDYKIAKPEHIDEETFKSEGMQGQLKAFRDAMHAAHAPANVVAAALDTYWQIQKATQEAVVAADTSFAEQSEAALRQRWGADYDKNKTLADRAAQKFFGDDYDEAKALETKDGRFIFDHPLLLNALAAAGREMAEGGLVPKMTETEADQAQEELSEIREKIRKAQSEKDVDRANKWYAKEQELLAKMGGSAPVVGAEGRVV